jgi:hypothetical protein
MGENYSDFLFISLSKNSKVIKFMPKFELHVQIESVYMNCI